VLQIIVANNTIDDVRALALQEIVRSLNEGFNKEHPRGREAHANLIQLIQAWQEARDAPVYRTAEFIPESGSSKTIRAPLSTLETMKFPPGCPPTWIAIQQRCQPHLPAEGTGATMFVKYGEKGKPYLTAWDDALDLFVQLMTNPARDKFAGPCERCRKYYIKKRASQKKYCSRTCGNAATAVIRTREKWDAEHAEKLNRARKAAHQWARSKSADPWKEYVHTKHDDISPKFLTRAVNKNELSEPKRS
jgi:hypothetical protein